VFAGLPGAAGCRVLPGAAGLLPGAARLRRCGGTSRCCRVLTGCRVAGLPVGCRVRLSGLLPGLCSGCQVGDSVKQ
jgi:hypothetical protein